MLQAMQAHVKIKTGGVMMYISFGSTNKKISTLGFGAMRLPVINKDETRIDTPEALKMLNFAYDNGINYVDTACPYHEGNSEYVVGESLKTAIGKKYIFQTSFRHAW